MIPIYDIQGEMADAIRAHTYLAGITVIEDDGLSDPKIEYALGVNGKGVVIVVTPPYSMSAYDNAPGLAAMVCNICAFIRFNPQRNAEDGGAGLNFMRVVAAVHEGVANWRPSSGTDKWVFNATRGELDVNKTGEFSFDLHFKKHVTFKGATS